MATPTFTMSWFLLPIGVCRNINRLIRDFLWGQQQDEKKVCWVGWDRLTQSKHDGRMGFKDLHCFNIAMLARQAWRIIQNPNALWVRVLKSLYFPNSSFFDARKGSHPSWAWSSILRGRDLVQLGARWNVGNGQDILIYQDKWVPTLPGFKVTSLPTNNSVFSYVCDLLMIMVTGLQLNSINFLVVRNVGKSLKFQLALVVTPLSGTMIDMEDFQLKVLTSLQFILARRLI
ncbi:hypothetical protein SLE2022_348010 [Rubroshorea leprosula]